MIYQQKVSLVIRLCRDVEGGRPKCAPYWLQRHYSNITDDDNGTHLTIEKVSDVIIGGTSLTLFKITAEQADSSTGHHHFLSAAYMNWPDHSTPEIDDFKKFFSLFFKDLSEDNIVRQQYNDYLNVMDPHQKILVHCR